MTSRRRLVRELPLYLMLAPAVALVLVYSYAPMVGIVMAFQRVLPGRGIFGSPWIGLDNFTFMIRMPNILQVLWNTIRIAGLKAVGGVVVPVAVALMLNNVTSQAFKRTVQTIIYLPHFLSWVILAGIFVEILSPSGGAVNLLLGRVGLGPVYFLGDDRIFPLDHGRHGRVEVVRLRRHHLPGRAHRHRPHAV
jgi:putative aldouronate transport system permease protein